MDRFEYEVFKVERKKSLLNGENVKETELKKRLNQLGKDGWELVTKIDNHKNGWTENIFLLFKRKILDDPQHS